jgi:hypothetical protein
MKLKHFIAIGLVAAPIAAIADLLLMGQEHLFPHQFINGGSKIILLNQVIV